MLVCEVPGELHWPGAMEGAWIMVPSAGAGARSRKGTFEQHWWGKLRLSRNTCTFFSLSKTVSKYDHVFNPLVNKVNIFLIHKYHCTGQFSLLVPAGVVMPSSVRKDAPTQLTGLVRRQRTLDAIPERHSWHRQVTAITPWPVARSDPGMGGTLQCHPPANWVH